MPTRRLCAILTVFVALFSFAAPALGAPGSQDDTNLLLNADFEGSYTGEGGDPMRVPENWDVWYLDNPDGCYDQTPMFEKAKESERLHAGGKSVQIGVRDGTFTAGVLQVVDGVESGQSYKFSAWGHVLYAPDPTATASSGPDPRMKVGIDPTGGTNPFADTVRWSEINWEFDTYYQFSVVATAESSTLTVFTFSTQPECLATNFTFWDDAALVPTDEPETPAELAQEYNSVFRDVPPTAMVKTSTTEFEVGATVSSETAGGPAGGEADEGAGDAADASGTGSICLLMFADENSSGNREIEEAKLAGGIFTLVDAAQVVGTYTTDGVNEPYCFSNLPPGSYTLTWEAQGLQPTSSQGWAVSLNAGETLSREFGAVEGEGAAGGTGLEGRLVPALALACGVIVLLLGLGAGAYVILSRRGSDDDQPPGPPTAGPTIPIID